LLVPAAASAQEPPDPALVQRGQRVFLYCAACHNLQPGQSAKVGPILSGVVGAHAASRSDYEYSPALKQSGLVWTEENLEKWLTKPGDLVPGTKMAFIGLAKPEDRAAVIAYLQITTH
jgi:cytochrome c